MRFGRLLIALPLGLSLAGSVGGQSRGPSTTSRSSSSIEQVSALIAEATEEYEQGRFEKAKASFQRALKQDPKNGAAHTYLGVIADRADQLNEAEIHFAAAAQADPLSPSAHNNYGAVLVRLGRRKEAANQFETSLRLNPNQPSALVNLAQIRSSDGTIEGLQAARQLFERSGTSASDIQVSRALVVISLRLGDREGAARFYSGYEQLISGGSIAAHSDSRYELGAALLAAGLLSEAVEELRAALAGDPLNVKTTLLLARAFIKQDQLPSAGRTLESAVTRGLTDAAIYASLADVYEKSRHIENAIPAMRLAIASDPKNESYRFRYGMLLTDSKAPAAAVLRLEEALKEFPGSSRLWFALGVAHFAEHRTDEAAKAFARVLNLDPKFAPALSYLGMTSAEEGRSDDAVAFFQRSLVLDEKSGATHYLLAATLLKQVSADNNRIESHLTRAVALDPSFASSRLTLGKLYVRLARLPEAAEQFQRAVDLNPTLVEAHYQLAQVYRRMKKTNESQTELATFKRLSDNQKEQAEADRQDLVRRLAKVRF